MQEKPILKMSSYFISVTIWRHLSLSCFLWSSPTHNFHISQHNWANHSGLIWTHTLYKSDQLCCTTNTQWYVIKITKSNDKTLLLPNLWGKRSLISLHPYLNCQHWICALIEIHQITNEAYSCHLLHFVRWLRDSGSEEKTGGRARGGKD